MDCTKAFRTKLNIGQHVNPIDETKKKIKSENTDHECGFCGKNFSTNSYLRGHVTHIYEEFKNYKC